MFQSHSKNLRAIDSIQIYLARSIKNEIRNKQSKSAKYLTRTYALLLGAWSECRLNKLLTSNNGFSATQQNNINSSRTIQMRWERLIDTAFHKHYSATKINRNTIGQTRFMQYQTIVSIMEEYVYPIIILRNKLAHGQFEHPLSNGNTSVSYDLVSVLNQENIMTLQYKRKLLAHIIDLVECLVMSKPAFERDFDRYYNMIMDTKHLLVTKNYTKYVQNLQARRRQQSQGT